MFLRELYAEFAEKTDCPRCPRACPRSPRSASLPSAERPGGAGARAGADERHASREFRQKGISEIRKIRVIRILVSSPE
jgi:hypothetical protein